MPSLKALEDFKLFFRTLGNEEAVLAAQNVPVDDLALPDAEPSAPPPSFSPAPPPDDGGIPAFPDDLTGDGPPEPDFEAGDGDDFDFSAFLDTIPDDLPLPGPELPESPEGTAPGSGDAAFNLDDDAAFNLDDDAALNPDDAALNLDDDAALNPDDAAFNLDDDAALNPDDAAFNLDDDAALNPDDATFNLDDDAALNPDDATFNLDDDTARNPDDAAFNLDDDAALNPDDAAFNLDDDAALNPDDAALSPDDFAFNFDDADLNLDDTAFNPDDTSLSPDAAAPSSDDATLSPDGAALSPDDFAFSPDDAAFNLDDAALSPDGAAPSPEAPADAQEPSLAAPDGAAPDADAMGSLEEIPPDPFDAFNVDQDPGAGAALPNEKDEAPGKFPDLEAFGIDDIFAAPAPSGGASSAAAGAAAGTSAGSGQIPEVEEINLTDDELERLERTLEGYPLNLRIACEEIIVEQAVAPDLMSAFIKLLVRGGSPREAASQAGKILGRTISIPRGFEKKTGEALEEEQGSFPYIFVHTFLPVLRIFFAAALGAAALFYLVHQFIYTPLRADRIYRLGYERIGAGEYERANERFNEAFRIHRAKDWFFRYAEAFRNARQYLYAEQRYDELLRFYPRDKKGALDYAAMETNELRNYSKAERILRTHILDYALDDQEGLLALGDNNMAWGELEPPRYEDARQAYARLLERYGWKDPIVERMLLYFIRTDNLKEVLPLQRYFTEPSRGKIRPAALAELGGYLLDKRLEEARGVPDENIERIEGLRDLLVRAVQAAPGEPEPHYHLARYFNRFGDAAEERQSLETAVRAFDRALEESPRRSAYRIDAERRYARILVKAREFYAAEEQLSKGVAVYQDALDRRLLTPFPNGGGLYADLGDIEYFAKSGDMEAALGYYRQAEQNLWAPPEMVYRMGSAYYHLGRWAPAQERFLAAAAEIPLNRRLLHALGNISYIRGNYFAAQGYYNRLLDLLDAERARFPLLLPHEREDHLELAERMMVARNNMGVTLEALSGRTGNPAYRSGALGFYSESARAWDALTRDPDSMVRSGAGELSTPGINLAYLNSRNLLYPQEGYEPLLFRHIDKDVLEPSEWEDLAPAAFRLSDQLAGPTGAF
jgi:tetratricopeptide (TPR) repeat protein